MQLQVLENKTWNHQLQSFIHVYTGYLGVSENSDTPKSSILIGFSIINHPFWGTTIFGNTHIVDSDFHNRPKTKAHMTKGIDMNPPTALAMRLDA